MATTLPGFLDNIIVEAITIVETISWRSERKSLIIAVSTLLISKYF